MSIDILSHTAVELKRRSQLCAGPSGARASNIGYSLFLYNNIHFIDVMKFIELNQIAVFCVFTYDPQGLGQNGENVKVFNFNTFDLI